MLAALKQSPIFHIRPSHNLLKRNEAFDVWQIKKVPRQSINLSSLKFTLLPL